MSCPYLDSYSEDFQSGCSACKDDREPLLSNEEENQYDEDTYEGFTTKSCCNKTKSGNTETIEKQKGKAAFGTSYMVSDNDANGIPTYSFFNENVDELIDLKPKEAKTLQPKKVMKRKKMEPVVQVFVGSASVIGLYLLFSAMRR